MKTKQIVIILNTVEAGEEYLSHTAGRDEDGTVTWKIAQYFLLKLNIHVQNKSAIIPYGIYPRAIKTYVPITTYTQLFTVTLFILT